MRIVKIWGHGRYDRYQRGGGIQQADLPYLKEDEEQQVEEPTDQLQNREDPLGSLSRAVPVGIFRMDPQGRCVYVNERWCSITGLTAAEAFDQGWVRAIHPGDQAEVVAKWSQAMQEKRVFKIESRLQNEVGQITWVYAQVVLELDADGTEVGYIGTITDISDRKETELALAASQRKLSTLIGNLPGYVYRVHNDRDYTPEFISSGVTAITGYSVDEYLVERSISCGQEIHPDDGERVWDIVQQAIHDRRSYECEYRLITKTGMIKWVWERGQGILSETGEIEFLEGFVTDITARKEAAAALYKTQQQFEEAQRIAHIGNWELNLHLNHLYWSAEVFRIFEQDPQTFRPSFPAFLEAIHPDDRNAVQCTYIQHLNDRTPYHIIHRILLPEDRIKYVREECETRYAEDGTPLISLGTVQDVTIQEEAERSRQEAEEAMRQVVQGTAAVVGEKFFPNLVYHLAAALDVAYALVGEQVGAESQTLCLWANGAFQPPIRYPVASTPCEYVLKEGSFYCEKNLQEQFPTNRNLVTMQADSYLGLALRDDWGNILGHLCVLDIRPFPPAKRMKAMDLLQVFAARASAELQRKLATEALRQFHQELEARVEERTIELQTREAQLSNFFDNATDLIQSMTPDGQILLVNTAWKRTLGYTDEELVDLSIFQVIHPDDLETYQAMMQNLFVGDPGLSIEIRFLSKNGQEITVEGNINAQWQTGKAIEIWGIFRDVTKRKQMEQSLRESQQFLQTVLDTFPLAVFWKNQDSILMGCNQLFASLSGLASPLDVVGRSNFDFGYTNAEAQGYLADDRQVMESGQPKLGIEETITLSSGESRWIETNKLPLLDLAGKVAGLVGTFQDITDRKKAEIALQAKTEELDRFFSMGLELLCIASTQGYFLRLNPQWEKVLGYPLAELESSQCLDYIHPDDVEKTKKTIVSLESGKIINNFVNRYRCQDGSYRWLEWTAVRTETLIYAGARDISDRLETEEKLRESNEQLARATRLKDEFLANMSHELRTPLNAILGMTEGLQDSIFGDINGLQRKALATIERSGSHLLELINDILDIAKIEAGQIELEMTPTELLPLCQSSLVFVKQQALKKKIRLDVQIPLGLPDLLVDERRIRQVLINLLNNAVKFTPEYGSITLTAKPSPDRKDYLTIAIEDTGIGISTTDLGKLFQPFVQIDSALNRQYEGTGLGLALVKRIVELHGGTVNVTSTLGVGSTFSLELPCSSFRQSLACEAPEIEIPTVNPLEISTNFCILLVEDNEASMNTISSYLKAKGYDVLFARNGLEAIEMAKTHQPHLILMDIQMPEMDGIQATQHIRSHPNLKNIPIIALTALAMQDDRTKCLEARMNLYLTKPVRLKQLCIKIQELLLQPSR